MRDTKVAYRYAKSILGLAAQRNEADRVEEDFVLMVRVLKENREMRVFLNSPVVKGDKKEKVLIAVFGDHISVLMKAFIQILTKKGREYLLHDIAQSYLEQIRISKGIMSATVETATELDGESREIFAELVKAFNSGGGILLNEKTNPEVIGGFVLKVEDKMLDASVAGQFRKLRRQLTKNLYEASI
jgi:F-type H+-transporting ATPase subunit delta